jgi:hypothetical protein
MYLLCAGGRLYLYTARVIFDLDWFVRHHDSSVIIPQARCSMMYLPIFGLFILLMLSSFGVVLSPGRTGSANARCEFTLSSR